MSHALTADAGAPQVMTKQPVRASKRKARTAGLALIRLNTCVSREDTTTRWLPDTATRWATPHRAKSWSRWRSTR